MANINIQDFINEKFPTLENKRAVKSLVLVYNYPNQINPSGKIYNQSNSNYFNFSSPQKLEGELDLSEFINLEDLVIYSGSPEIFFISDIIVDNCSKLKVLMIFYNKNLEKINIANNKELKIFNAYSCTELKEISDLKENKELIYLYLNNNQLSNVDLKENKKLTQLNLGYNQLSNVDLKENKKLTQLNLGYNQLSNVDLKENKTLYQVQLQENPNLINISGLINIVKLYTFGTPLSFGETTSQQAPFWNQLKTELNQLKTKIINLESGQEVRNLQNRINQLEQQIRNFEQEEITYRRRIEQIENQKTELEEKERNFLISESEKNTKIQELENKLSVVKDFLLSGREEFANSWEIEKQEFQNKILELTEKLARKEEQVNYLQERVDELKKTIDELKEKNVNFENLQQEVKNYEEQLNNLNILIGEKDENEEELKNQINELRKKLQSAKDKSDKKNENILERIDEIIKDDEDAREFQESLKRTETKKHFSNKNFFLDWIKEFSEIDEKFSLDCFLILFPDLEIEKEEFKEELQKDFLINYICLNDKWRLTEYLVSSQRIRKKFRELIELRENNVIKFFSASINLFYKIDPVFTGKLFKIIRKDQKEEENKKIKEQIIPILNLWAEKSEKEKKRAIENVAKMLSSELEKSRYQFGALRELLNKYSPNNKLIELKEKWAEMLEIEEIKRKETKKNESWADFANFIQEFNRHGYLMKFFRDRKLDEAESQRTINALLQSIQGTLTNDNDYHHLPEIDLDKKFEELIPWKTKEREGVDWGHKVLSASSGDIVFNAPPSSPIIKPNEEEPKKNKKRSIYGWYADNDLKDEEKLNISDYNKLQQLAGKGIIEQNFFIKLYSWEEIEEMLNKELPKPKSSKPESDKPEETKLDLSKYLLKLGSDCENYLSWQFGDMVDDWNGYWIKVRKDLEEFNEKAVKEGIKEIKKNIDFELFIENNEKKKRRKELKTELNKIVGIEKPKIPELENIEDDGKDWKNISLDFDSFDGNYKKKLWLWCGFTYENCKDWINIGLNCNSYFFAKWLRDEKNLTPEEVLNYHNLEELEKEYNETNFNFD